MDGEDYAQLPCGGPVRFSWRRGLRPPQSGQWPPQLGRPGPQLLLNKTNDAMFR